MKHGTTRHTSCGLKAVYDRPSRLWLYYRLDIRSNTYVLTGSTIRFQG